MTPSQRLRLGRSQQHTRDLATRRTGVTQPRQSPLIDIRTLTRLVFESYQDSFMHSSPKVRRRYQKLISELSDHARHRERGR